jgi:hypothetical protein
MSALVLAEHATRGRTQPNPTVTKRRRANSLTANTKELKPDDEDAH